MAHSLGVTGALIAYLAVGGCAGWMLQPASRPGSRLLAASPEALWSTLRAALASEGYAIRLADEARGVLIAQRDYSADALPVYAADPIARLNPYWWSLNATLIVQVAAADGGKTRMSVNTRLAGREDPAALSATRRAPWIIPLRSNGTLERQLLKRLEAAASLPDLDHTQPSAIR
ncbi:MAG: hypothetical protein HY598_02100 [Candidatus Omnitrophica bacterium]|nr:hypothetical protein [Candidatus Omnitrophota bacterium]